MQAPLLQRQHSSSCGEEDEAQQPHLHQAGRQGLVGGSGLPGLRSESASGCSRERTALRCPVSSWKGIYFFLQIDKINKVTVKCAKNCDCAEKSYYLKTLLNSRLVSVLGFTAFHLMRPTRQMEYFPNQLD